MKSLILQKLDATLQMISSPDVNKYKEINLNSFDLSNEQLLTESSRTLIARVILKIIIVDKEMPVSHSLAEYVGSMLDPDLIALVRDSQLSKFFGITVEELKVKRDSGLLLCVEKRSSRMYDWNQVRKLFGKLPESSSNPKR